MGFLDTPLDTCIERVKQRRLERGNDKPFDPNRTLVKDYKAVRQARDNAITQGFRVVDIDHTNPTEYVLRWMMQLVRGE
jgi:hypothetical protein